MQSKIFAAFILVIWGELVGLSLVRPKFWFMLNYRLSQKFKLLQYGKFNYLIIYF